MSEYLFENRILILGFGIEIKGYNPFVHKYGKKKDKNKESAFDFNPCD